MGTDLSAGDRFAFANLAREASTQIQLALACSPGTAVSARLHHTIITELPFGQSIE